MAAANDSARAESLRRTLARIPTTIRHAFASFLGVPTAVVGAFLLLAVATYLLDQSEIGWLRPLRRFLRAHLFANASTTAEVLSTIAGGMITVTSITFSLLLVALQQSAASMSHAVFDQFLRRPLNQVYAGWFIGLTLYVLVTLASVDAAFNPIFGATLALLLAVSALYVLLLLIYAAIAQMRPAAIIEAIHDHSLRARARQQPLLRRTRREPRRLERGCHLVRAPSDGFLTAIDLDILAAALAEAPHGEVVLRLSIGGYAAFHDPLAEIHAVSAADVAALTAALIDALRLDRERDLDLDPSYGIEQIATIGWTSISTSKQDPIPGLEAVRNLRDLLVRWAVPDTADDDEDHAEVAPLNVVYPDDLIDQLLSAIGSMAVVSSESMQHQVYAEILRGFAISLDRLPPPLVRRTEAVVLRSLAGLGDQMLTAELDAALVDVAAALERKGLHAGALAVRTARAELARSIGRLNSRATRVPDR
jgi:uncharacterized membrane protein